MPEKHFLELMKVTPTTHDWVLLNLKYKRMFNNNWDEIIFEDEKKPNQDKSEKEKPVKK